MWSSCLSVEELRFSLNFVTVAEQPIESSFSFLPQVSFLDHCQGNLIDNEESEHNPEVREKHGVPIFIPTSDNEKLDNKNMKDKIMIQKKGKFELISYNYNLILIIYIIKGALVIRFYNKLIKSLPKYHLI